MGVRDGLVVVDKAGGMTSHDVVARIRRLAGTRRVGHAGTLDPMATGVLVLGINRATRLLGHLTLTDKAYDATIRLGASTVTDDAQGEVVTTADASRLTDDAVRSGVADLTGDIAQVPSAVSAV
jgi:tRNA pseudouridine55 synthase